MTLSNAAAVVVLAAVAIVAVLGTWLLVRNYCRVKAVQSNRAGVWVLGRPAGMLAGTAVWMAVRFLTPSSGEATPLAVGITAFVSFGVLALIDSLAYRLLFDEPSFGESREAYLAVEGSDSEWDWIDETYDRMGERR